MEDFAEDFETRALRERYAMEWTVMEVEWIGRDESAEGFELSV
jgi:hypothetical protein